MAETILSQAMFRVNRRSMNSSGFTPPNYTQPGEVKPAGCLEQDEWRSAGIVTSNVIMELSLDLISSGVPSLTIRGRQLQTLLSHALC